MAAPLEKELKYALSAKTHARLVAALAHPEMKVLRQHNFYFDDAVLSLRRRRFGLRIRLVDDKQAILAVKYPPPPEHESAVASFKVRRELESDLNLAVARRVIAGEKAIGDLDAVPMDKVREVFSTETVRTLRAIGDLRTERTVVPFGDGLYLEIDACQTLDRVFFELEVETETPEATDTKIRALLKEHEIPYRPLRRSKLARVFTTIRDQQKHLRTQESQLARVRPRHKK